MRFFGYTLASENEPLPMPELNRAVAISTASGPQPGLDLVDAIANAKELAGYHLLPSVRGDLLWKFGRLDEARAEFERAAVLRECPATRTARARAAAGAEPETAR